MHAIHSVRPYLTPTLLVGVVGAVSLLSLVYVLITGHPAGGASYVQPTTGPLAAEVDTTGTVKAADTIDLSFDAAGRIASVRVSAGTHVAAGTVLASIAGSDAAAALAQAQAGLAVQQAKLDGLKTGARPESIAVAQTAVSGAQASLAQSRLTLAQAVQDSYVKADDAITNRVDMFISNPHSASPTLPFTLTDGSLQNAVIAGRISAVSLLAQWQVLATTMSDPAAATPDAVQATRTDIQTLSSYLDSVARALTVVVPNTSYPTATIQSYASSVATARSNLSTTLAALNAAATAEKAAESALANAQSQLTLAQAPATDADLAAQQAQVAVAQANVAAAQSQLGKTVVRAPIAGTISRSDAHVGAYASPAQPLFTLISDSRFQVEAYVSQDDLALMQPGQAASVRLDAYPDDTFAAHVLSVDPAATVQNGISAYRALVQFDSKDARIKAGLTANVTVVASQKDAALQVPSSAIIKQRDQAYVMAQRGGTDTLVPVSLGIVGATSTEILSGITSADSVRVFGSN